MTKARARERAKAKAAQKTKKRVANVDQSGQNIAPGKFDPNEKPITSMGATASSRSLVGAKKGSARSR